MPFDTVCVRFRPWFPVKSPDAWEAHRAAVIEDVRPVGALELALAEQVAIKLWRLGRVVRFEADMIGNAQDPEEVAHTHEKRHARSYGGPSRTDIPTRKDVQERQARDRQGQGENGRLRGRPPNPRGAERNEG